MELGGCLSSVFVSTDVTCVLKPNPCTRRRRRCWAGASQPPCPPAGWSIAAASTCQMAWCSRWAWGRSMTAAAAAAAARTAAAAMQAEAAAAGKGGTGSSRFLAASCSSQLEGQRPVRGVCRTAIALPALQHLPLAQLGVCFRHVSQRRLRDMAARLLPMQPLPRCPAANAPHHLLQAAAMRWL